MFLVVVDKRKDPNADTGLFELIYKQNYPRTPPYLGMNLSVRGRKIFKSRMRIAKSEGKVRVCGWAGSGYKLGF